MKTIITRDMQALSTYGVAAGVPSAFAVAAVETALSSSTTQVIGTGTGPHTTDDALGQMLLANTAADWSGATLYGVVQGVDASTPGQPRYTVDRWYTLTGLPSGGQPSFAGGNHYIVLPCSAPFWFAALSDTSVPPTGSESGQSIGGTELQLNGLGRKLITTVARSVGATALTLSTTFTYTPPTSPTAQLIGRAALVCSSVALKNFLYYVDQLNGGTPSQVANNGDQFTPTWNIVLG